MFDGDQDGMFIERFVCFTDGNWPGSWQPHVQVAANLVALQECHTRNTRTPRAHTCTPPPVHHSQHQAPAKHRRTPTTHETNLVCRMTPARSKQQQLHNSHNRCNQSNHRTTTQLHTRSLAHTANSRRPELRWQRYIRTQTQTRIHCSLTCRESTAGVSRVCVGEASASHGHSHHEPQPATKRRVDRCGFMQHGIS